MTRASSSPRILGARLCARPRILFVGRPEVIAFVGTTVYRAFFGPRVAGGAGPKPERVGEARVFVLPNPSGRNAVYPGFRDKRVWFEALERYVESDEGCI